MKDEKRRGISMEKQFAEWMKSDLGYNSTRRRVPVTGKISERFYDVDIYAEKFSRAWELARRLGLFLFVLSIITYVLPTEMEPVRNLMVAVVASFDPTWASSAVFVIGVAAVVIAYLGKRRATRFAWVECKDTKSNVKRAQIQKLISSVQDVRDSEDAKWKPDVVIMVAGSDFDADALNFARETDIVCYRRSGDFFEEVEL